MSSTVVAKKGASDKVKHVLWSLLGPSQTSMLPFVPRPIKLLVAFIFIFNWRSWPFVWHWNVWKWVFKVRWTAIRKSKTLPQRKRFISDLSCVNADPFEVVSRNECYAGWDDCDFNAHLSNSAYAKNLDPARMKACIDLFPAIFGDGGRLALGGAQYFFIREIPRGAHYEIQTTIGGYDDKWMYLVHRFITYPTKEQLKKKSTAPPALSGPSTPALAASPPQVRSPAPVYKAPATVPAAKVRKALLENAVVHCIAVSLYCFKVGRLTVPPRVAFVATGFGDPSKKRWFTVQDLRFSPGSKPGEAKNLVNAVLKGGWKTDVVPGWEARTNGEGSAFWDLEEFEDKRKRAMEETWDGWQVSLKSLKDKLA